ncbi:DUF4013 domain-containing protein [Halomicrobium sp. IBSBa]|uniref:DUF4013 domain-containing protein n=1 Tax=Halomicrobium sp. IBSBa TaxID=2778916 RepID=UPI001ABFED34|nr:DUF4013 domain-containing protein [Halomicrobium sp. IBSBa]MBO4248631.1 DUF4013 domain-containing protein [Halomicrobium sp. IBSBa]
MRPSTTAATYPIAGDARERPLLAVWLSLALSFVVPVVPLLPVVGYVVRALTASERGDALPPFLADGRTLLRQSVGGSVLCVFFLGLPLAALLVTVYGVVTLDASAGDLPTGRILAGSTATLFVGLLGLYLLPIALTVYGQTGSLREAFSIAPFRSIGGHGAYFFGWTLGFVALTVTLGIGGSLLTFSRVGPLLGTFVFAYGFLVATYLWGRAIARARRR